MVDCRSVVASLYSTGASSSGTNSQTHRSSSRPLSSISLSPDGSYAVASGRDVLHLIRLYQDEKQGESAAIHRLEEVRSVRVSQAPLQSSTTSTGEGARIPHPQYPHVHDVLSNQGAGSLPTHTAGGGGGVNVTVTDVAWSLPQPYYVDYEMKASKLFGVGRGNGVASRGDSVPPDSCDNDATDSEQHPWHYPSFVKRIHLLTEKSQSYTRGSPHSLPIDDSSIVAAAGSNGVVVAWHAHSTLLSDNSASSTNADGQSGFFHILRGRAGESASASVSPVVPIGQPEAVFLGHSRAINRLAWHPTGHRPYLLLTASQDGTVKLWDRRASRSNISKTVVSSSGPTKPSIQPLVPWFDLGRKYLPSNVPISLTNSHLRTSNWHCISTFQPKCEAVRDVVWNPVLDDVFAMVTDNGTLCVYDIRLNRPMMKISAHAGEATSVDWHPTQKYIVATGGGRDRSVQVWDLESGLNLQKQDDNIEYMKANSGSFVSDNSESLTNASFTSSEGALKSDDVDNSKSVRSNPNQTMNQSTIGSQSMSSSSPLKKQSCSSSRFHKQNVPLHVLSISSPVTRLRWRPNEPMQTDAIKYDSMIAVATSSISGANSGGNGSVGLWACSRQFIPVSICEGHTDGAVTDFSFVKYFHQSSIVSLLNKKDSETFHDVSVESHPTYLIKGPPSKISLDESSSERYNRRRLYKEKSDDNDLGGRHKQPLELSENKYSGHAILTVGRDGQCLLQNFLLGQRPILEVPSCTFSLANLSPFQRGYGSLQIMTVNQRVDNKGILTVSNHLEPLKYMSELIFSVTDQGDVEDLSTLNLAECVDIAPELTHLSRLSEHYVMSIGDQLVTKADVCRHNGTVAEGLNQKALANMWRTLAIILEGSLQDTCLRNPGSPLPSALSSLFVSTLQKLLLQRALAGDVQTCVVLCEVMDVISPPIQAGDFAKSTLPNTDIELIREWYLSYIDLLQQMCLFTQAAYLIRNCRDPVIGALNQQSTTINESCPLCAKPLLGGTTMEDGDSSRSKISSRLCRTCKGRMGHCFLCHEPVRGIFVWCPGCGHGGHLDHALDWFGSNEVCPTGCGHRCNLFPPPVKR